jgi:hypothetical protein
MTTRAEALAHRILDGAKALGEYAVELTDTQWKTVARPDRRKVGVIVHHVASVYPIEVQLAQQIASGTPIEDVTWSVIADMNAIHAVENKDVCLHETLHLLQRNSRVAAEAVRNFTDEQLDRAVPVSLNANAPLTTQFMIEDHAVRHSWHHLEKIKAALRTAHPGIRRTMLTTVP